MKKEINSFLISMTILLVGCQSPQQQNVEMPLPRKDTIKNEKEILLTENYAKYKYDTKELLNKIQSSASKINSDTLVNTAGAYELSIDTNGVVTNVEVKRSISSIIDLQIINVCDTLTFYPLEIDGNKLESKIILPIRIEIGE